jgi:hypothetical protein
MVNILMLGVKVVIGVRSLLENGYLSAETCGHAVY